MAVPRMRSEDAHIWERPSWWSRIALIVCCFSTRMDIRVTASARAWGALIFTETW